MPSPLKPLPSIFKKPGTGGALIAVAASQIGYKEGSNNDTIYGKMYGMNNQPWCAMFVTICSRIAGCAQVIPKFAYTPAGAEWFKKQGRWRSKPRRGAIAFFDTSGMGRISHVGIVDKVYKDGSFTCIEGNTNAAGSREGRVVRRQRRRTVGPRGGFGYPEYRKSRSNPKFGGLKLIK